MQASGGGIEFGLEGELVEVSEEFGHGRTFGGHSVGTVDEGKQSLKHARSGTGCGHEFLHFAAVGQVLLPTGDGGVFLFRGEVFDAAAEGGATGQTEEGEAGGEALQLLFHLFRGDAAGLQES